MDRLVGRSRWPGNVTAAALHLQRVVGDWILEQLDAVLDHEPDAVVAHPH